MREWKERAIAAHLFLSKAEPLQEQTLKHLGRASSLPDKPAPEILEAVTDPHPEDLYLVRFVCPEFTSLCPVTGQPDFAHIVLDYAPRAHLVESKSLKLYFASFRNHGEFHEGCTVSIGKALGELLNPHWLRIGGYWFPRGGMPIDVFYQSGEPPKGLWIPSQDVQSYRGRG